MDSCVFHFSSSITKNSYVLSWSVKNCVACSSGTHVYSQRFYLKSGIPFTASFIAGNQDFNFYLNRREARDEESLRVEHNMSVADRAGKVFSNVSKTYTYTKDEYYCGFKFTVSEISEFNKAAKDHVLVFICEMAFEELNTESNNIKRYPEPTSMSLYNLTALAADMKSMLSASQHADVSLTSGGIVFRAHKAVLRARSPVFDKMFETPLEESEKNVVDVTDLEPSVVEDLVDFLYTGQLAKDDFESAYSLYSAADKYDVSSLGKTCSDILLSKLDVRNACRVLVLADQHSDEMRPWNSYHPTLTVFWRPRCGMNLLLIILH